MEKIANRMRQISVFVFIMLLLSITWLFLDYFVFQGIISEFSEMRTFDIVLIKVSFVVFAIFFISVILLLWYGFRLRGKLEKSLDSIEEENNQ